jgi:flagellar biosynthesis protein FlhG
MARPDRDTPRPRLVAVGGGKGGVGKSMVAAHLAIVLGRLGYRTTLVDADLGAPNLHTLLGLARPGPGLAGFLDHDVATLAEAAVSPGVPNVSLVSGTARPGDANLNHGQKLRLLRAIATLPAEVVVIDVGAGSAYNTLDFVVIADVKLVVATPELTSLCNAYAFLKACVQRVVKKLAKDAAAEALFAGGDARPLRAALAELARTDAVLAAKIGEVLDGFGAAMVGNLIAPGEDAVIARMSHMIGDYLRLRAPVLASLPRADEVRHAAMGRGVALSETGELATSLRGLARAVVAPHAARRRGATMPQWITDEPA